jgi:acetyl esterase/lipase
MAVFRYRTKIRMFGAGAVVALGCISPALAQMPQLTITRIAAPAEPDAIRLYPGKAPGSERATQKEVWSHFIDQRIVRNVTRPTLTPVLPDPAKANGTAVLVVPGGGFKFVSMDNEGWPVARWLADRGVAAFILKYRLEKTPDSEAEFTKEMQAMFSGKVNTDTLPGVPFAVADAQAALKMIRSNAGKWKIDPKRVGMLGFSAGAMTTLGVTLANDPAARADFIAPIYGPMGVVTVPENAPPMFVALAADDPLFGGKGYGLVDSWSSAKRPVELHVYDHGGHGFGSMPKGTTSDHWFEEYAWWLQARGLLTPSK